MIEHDGRTEEQVFFLIDWSQKHHFWTSNILSIGKLREKFDRPEPLPGDAADENTDFLVQRAAMEAELAAREAGKVKMTG